MAPVPAEPSRAVNAPRTLRLLAAGLAAATLGWQVPPVAAATVVPTTTTTAPTSTTVAPTTTAPHPVTPPPAATTPSRPPATSPVPGAPPGPGVPGVPGVPTGGPPTTAPAPGQTVPPAPPVDTTAAVAGVNADLARLDAIASFGSLQAALASSRQQLAAAAAALSDSRLAAATLESRRLAAVGRVANSRSSVAQLAVAAYTGSAYASPTTPPSPSGTVSKPGGLPDTLAEAEVLLRLAVDTTMRSYADARTRLRTAVTQVARGATAVTAAASAVTTASAQVGMAQHAVQKATAVATAVAPSPTPAVTTATTTGGGPTILGPSVATAAELAAWYATTGSTSAATVPVAQLADEYAAAGAQTGVRADLAFVQSIIETGYFSFPTGGQLTGADNNFAGIGACDSCSHGWAFPDALTGVTAQLQLLDSYASPTKVPTPLIGPVGVGGCCTTWSSLAGRWASNKAYGVDILTLYKKVLDWVVPQRLALVGLSAPVAASGPPKP